MKNNKICIVLAYVILGLLPTIFLFVNHDWMCKYDMNPLCYIWCALPAIISTPILLFDGVDK